MSLVFLITSLISSSTQDEPDLDKNFNKKNSNKLYKTNEQA